MCEYKYPHAIAHVWRSEDKFQESVIAFTLLRHLSFCCCFF